MKDRMLPSTILRAVMAERAHQDEKYGPVDNGGGHELPGWLLIIRKELREAEEAATGHGARTRTGRNSVRSEILQIAAVCFAALEQHGLDPYEIPLQHLADLERRIAELRKNGTI